jgi:anti-sigma B factor antagonist
VADIDASSSRCARFIVVALRGELDVCDAAPLMRALSAAAAPGPPVIVDLAGLTLSDRSGLGALVYARKRALQAGGYLLLASPERPVLRLLSLTGLIGWLPVFASVEVAAAGSQRPPAHGRPFLDQTGGATSASNGEVARAREGTPVAGAR